MEGEKTKISESKFDEVLSIVVPNFKPFNYAVEDFCGYFQETGNPCPLLVADQDENRNYKHIQNWDVQNCMWVCRWFRKIDIPLDSKKRDDYYGSDKKKKPF